MDTAIAIGQGLGLAAAAGLLSAAPLAIAATAAREGWLNSPLHLSSRPAVLAATWALVLVELSADAIWPGAQAGGRLLRRVVAGGLAFELAAGAAVPWAGLAVGAVAAGAVAVSMRQVRARAVKAGGDLRGTALIEDGAGLGASLLALVPFAGFLLAGLGGGLLWRVRRREARKYQGLRVLR
ncbi:MAG TPA: DUF4126 family protein [Gaiellales bacterium]|nr:DUF4126 family protein [Gaiellales bacterium]